MNRERLYQSVPINKDTPNDFLYKAPQNEDDLKHLWFKSVEFSNGVIHEVQRTKQINAF